MSDPTRLRGIGQRGVQLNRACEGSGRDSTTVLACVSASGDILPPLIVFKGLAVQPRWMTKDELPGTMYSATKNGWMEKATFYMWFSKMFVPHVVQLRETNELQCQTAILFFDGHSSHIISGIIQMAISENIKLVKLPSHFTDKIQPVDVSVFGPIKTTWEQHIVEHRNTLMGTGSIRLKKTEFTGLLSKTWMTVKQTNIINDGFAHTGPEALDRYHKAQAMIRNNERTGDGKVMAIQEEPVVTVNMYRTAVLNTSSEEPLDLSTKKVAVVKRA